MVLTLQSKLIGAALSIAVLITAILSWLSYAELRDTRDRGIYSEVNAQAGSFGRFLSSWAVDRTNTMVAMATAFEKHIAGNGSVDHDAALDILNQGRVSGSFGLDYIGLEDGTMYRHDPELDKGKSDYDPRVRDWYKATREKMAPVVSKPYIAVTGNKLAITFTAPVMVDGRLYGVVGGTYYMDSILEDVLSLKVMGDGYAMLLESDGSISVHSDKSLILKQASGLNSAMTAAFLSGPEADKKLHHMKVSGQDTLVFFRHIENTQWVLALVMQNSVLAQPLHDLAIKISVSVVVILGAAAFVLIMLVGWLMKDMKKVSLALKEIAAGGGDLTRRIRTESNDEVGELARNFNRFVEFMHGIIGRLQKVGDELVTEADSTQKLSAQSAARIDSQQSEIEMVATAVNEMTQATQEIANNASNAAATSEEAVNLSVQGQNQVRKSQDSINKLAGEIGRTSERIGDLDKHVQAITTIVSTISGIAEQTNLLALNAAIEAARAGDQGRGFAVVADEVRVLSQRTHTSTEEIHKMILMLQEATRGAVSSMAESQQLADNSVEDAEVASGRLDEIRNAVRTISDMAGQIATAAEEQTSVTREINNNTTTISDAAGDMAAIVKKSAQQANELKGISDRMKSDIARFII